MIDFLPTWISALFLFASLLTILFFHYSNNKPTKWTLIVIAWSMLHSILAYLGFYKVLDTIPPRYALVLLPTIFLIVWGVTGSRRDWILKNRDLRISTLLHIVRIPVEFVLLYLFIYEMVPGMMSMMGKNYDILIGISAPIIAYLFSEKRLSKRSLFIWNIIGLIFVLFVFMVGILSAEMPFQQLAFDQPNRGINYFPFILLPATVVPIVIYTHLSDCIKLYHDIIKEKL